MIAVIILAWRLLGVNLAFAKGQTGDTVNWIGASMSIESTKTLLITIIKARLYELAEACRRLLASNTISIAKLRSFTGKCQSMASILFTWRPFVHMLYGTLYSTAPTKLPIGFAG